MYLSLAVLKNESDRELVNKTTRGASLA
jgi:hypothetical protein